MKTKLKKKNKLTEGKKCGYCPVIIFIENEAGHTIHFLDNKPVCVRCRILKGSKLIKQIKKDKPIFEAQKKEHEEKLQEEENKKVQEFALKNQIATDTGRLSTNE